MSTRSFVCAPLCPALALPFGAHNRGDVLGTPDDELVTAIADLHTRVTDPHLSARLTDPLAALHPQPRAAGASARVRPFLREAGGQGRISSTCRPDAAASCSRS